MSSTSSATSEGTFNKEVPHAYLLTNLVSHARFYPSPSKHAFKYTTLAILVRLDSLEKGQCDIPGVFAYRGPRSNGHGSGSWLPAICTLRPDLYLIPSSSGSGTGTITERLIQLLSHPSSVSFSSYVNPASPSHSPTLSSIASSLASGASEAWMLTMPAYLGVEGINPLTVYFIYSEMRELSLVVFEVHNTFGEAHAYFLQPGVHEEVPGFVGRVDGQILVKDADEISKNDVKAGMTNRQSNSTAGKLNGVTGTWTGAGQTKNIPNIPRAYDYSWTFPRGFHVSPFNDRTGFYTVRIKLPDLDEGSPKAAISIQLREPEDLSSSLPVPGRTKLTATLRTTAFVPFPSSSSSTSSNTTNSLRILFVLLTHPLTLLLSFARILYHARILHYTKGLQVWLRPEPSSEKNTLGLAEGPTDQSHSSGPSKGITIRRQSPSPTSRFGRERVAVFLKRRVAELGVGVVLMPPGPDGGDEIRSFPQNDGEKEGEGKGAEGIRVLKITYLSSRFFELILSAPSAGHALLFSGRKAGMDSLFEVNNAELFKEVFSSAVALPGSLTTRSSFAQRLRCLPLPPSLKSSSNSNSVTHSSALSVPAVHFLDSPPSLSSSTSSSSSSYHQYRHYLRNIFALSLILISDFLEPRIFALARAKVIPGSETWGGAVWARAGQKLEETQRERRLADA